MLNDVLNGGLATMTSLEGSVDAYCGHVMTILSQWVQSLAQGISLKLSHKNLAPQTSGIIWYYAYSSSAANKNASVYGGLKLCPILRGSSSFSFKFNCHDTSFAVPIFVRV